MFSPKLLTSIIKASIYGLVFLLPLFFAPFSFEAYEFNKQYLLFFLVSLAGLCWLAKMIIFDKEFRFRKTILDIPILIFMLIGILSAVFSIDTISSVLGYYGRFSNGLIGFLSLGILYFLITNNVIAKIETPETSSNEKKAKPYSPFIGLPSLIKVFFQSVSLVVITTYFSLFGIWQMISSKLSALNSAFALPDVMLFTTFNTASGSIQGLAMFLSVALVLLATLITTKTENTKRKNLSAAVLVLAMLGLLAIINSAPAWIVLLVSLSVFLIFSLWKRMFKKDVNKLLLPIFLIIIAALFAFTQIPSQIANSNLPQEQTLNNKISLQIAIGTLSDSAKNAVIGSGIGTFHYDFSKFKPQEFNQTNLWQIRFDRSGSHILEILATMGILGLLSYISLVGLFLIMSWLFIQAETKTTESKEFLNNPSIALLLCFLAVLFSQFIYYQNTSLAFLFWLMLGLSVVSWQKPIKEKKYSFKDFPEMSLIFSVILIVLLLVILGMYFFSAKFYLADYYFNKSLSIESQEIENLQKAQEHNPYRAQYKIVLARTYLKSAEKELSEGADVETILTKYIQPAISASKKAAEIAPNRVIVWETQGMIYRDIQGIVIDAVEWGIETFGAAIELEPLNPVLWTEQGKLLLANPDTEEKGKENFARAQELKPNYSDAGIEEGLFYEAKGNLNGAIEKLEKLSKEIPDDVEVIFQLGRLYYNNERTDDAVFQFKKAISLFPNHSNSRYSLAMAYEKQGEIDLAIREFENVLILNPNNQDVKDKIKTLKSK
jgi:tetratricopeptide (TPR) repeat protein